MDVDERRERDEREGRRREIMGDGIQINRTAERCSSHTFSHSRPVARRDSRESGAQRQKLIAALVEAVAEGSDLRLAKSRARS